MFFILMFTNNSECDTLQTTTKTCAATRNTNTLFYAEIQNLKFSTTQASLTGETKHLKRMNRFEKNGGKFRF